MKKKTLLKDLFREIFKTKKRFFSIVIITLLGVSFFVGIRVVGENMRLTGDAYYDDTAFMDISLVSTYGFNDNDIEAIENFSLTKEIFPSYSTDILLKLPSKKYTFKAHTLPEDEDIMNLELISGRLPENINEALINEGFGDILGINIGDTIEIEKTSPLDLTIDEITIVGTVKWPNYIATGDYGSSSLGNGIANGYVLLKEEAFDSLYYSDVYLRVNGASEYNTFSEEYEDFIEDVETDLEVLKETRQKDRLIEEQEEALKEIRKAEDILNSEKEKAYGKLEDAKNSLDETKADLDYNNEILLKEKENLTNTIEDIQNNSSIYYDMYLSEFYKNMGFTLEEVALLPPEIFDTLPKPDSKEVIILGIITQYENGIKEIDLGLKEISEGYTLLEEGYLEYNKNLQQANSEFSLAENEIEEAIEEVNDLEEPKWYILNRNHNSSFLSFKDNTIQITAVGVLFPLIFFLVASLVSLTTMTRMVEEDRTQIGVLKSLGYSKWDVSKKYIFYGLFTSLIGASVGFTLGTIAIPNLIYNAYRIMYQTPDLMTPIHYNYLLYSLVMGVFFVVAAAYFATRSELKENCASLLRPKVIKQGKKNILEYFPALWNKFNFKWKITIRNLFRYKKRFFMSVFGIGACTALLITGLGLEYSISSVANLQYGDIFKADGDIQLKEATSDFEDINSIIDSEYIKDSSYMNTQIIYISTPKKEYFLQGVTPIDEEKFTDMHLLKDIETGDILDIPQRGVLLSEKMANNLDVSPGDTIVIQDEDKKEYEVKLEGIVENYVFHYMYMDKDYYQEIFEKEAKTNAISFTLNDPMNTASYDLISETLLNEENISSIEFNSLVKEEFEEEMESLNFVILIIILCAGALAFVVLFNLNNINVSERKRELATIKVLGFHTSEVNMYLKRENIILTILGSAFGCLFGKYLHAYLITTVGVDFVQFYEGITLTSYLYGVLLTFIFSTLIDLTLIKTLRKINMIESLKSVE